MVCPQIAEFSTGEVLPKTGDIKELPNLQPTLSEPTVVPAAPTTQTLEKPEDDQYTVSIGLKSFAVFFVCTEKKPRYLENTYFKVLPLNSITSRMTWFLLIALQEYL